MFSILGRTEIGDGCGIDARNLSPRKRRYGSEVVTFIPFGPGASVENPGCRVIQCGLEIIVDEIFPENFNILVRCKCHGVGKKALRKFKCFFCSAKPEDALRCSQKVVGADHRSSPCESKASFAISTVNLIYLAPAAGLRMPLAPRRPA